WAPRRWAVAGGFITALHPVMLQWSASYWGGAVALAGGALVLGAMRRIWDAPKFRDTIVLAIGALMLANSRPFEGLLVCILTCVVLVLRMIYRQRGQGASVFRNVIVPALLILIPGFL